MSENEQRKVFAKNLNRYLDFSGKTQKEVAEAIGVSPQTFNTWTQAIALPRMSKIQLLADYFGVQKPDRNNHMWPVVFSGVQKCCFLRLFGNLSVQQCSVMFTI